ncbi:unnamed protein product, partial [Chrysoparadoxa australica]
EKAQSQRETTSTMSVWTEEVWRQSANQSQDIGIRKGGKGQEAASSDKWGQIRTVYGHVGALHAIVCAAFAIRRSWSGDLHGFDRFFFLSVGTCEFVSLTLFALLGGRAVLASQYGKSQLRRVVVDPASVVLERGSEEKEHACKFLMVDQGSRVDLLSERSAALMVQVLPCCLWILGVPLWWENAAEGEPITRIGLCMCSWLVMAAFAALIGSVACQGQIPKLMQAGFCKTASFGCYSCLSWLALVMLPAQQ